MRINNPGIPDGSVTPVKLSFLKRVHLVAQQADVPATLLDTPAADGDYLIFALIDETQAATTSSTLPQAEIGYTKASTGLASNLALNATNTANLVNATGLTAVGANFYNSGQLIRAKAGTAVNIETFGYASVGATPMQFELDVVILGPF